MAKKRQGRKELKKVPVKKTGKKIAIPRKIDAASLEDETIKRAGRTLTTLEAFLERWDKSGIKPQGMVPEIAKIKKFHEGLSSWQKNAMKARVNKDDVARRRRLRDFVLLCRSYTS